MTYDMVNLWDCHKSYVIIYDSSSISPRGSKFVITELDVMTTFGIQMKGLQTIFDISATMKF